MVGACDLLRIRFVRVRARESASAFMRALSEEEREKAFEKGEPRKEYCVIVGRQDARETSYARKTMSER